MYSQYRTNILMARAGISNITFFCPNNVAGCKRYKIEPVMDNHNGNQSRQIRKNIFTARRVNNRTANLATRGDTPKTLKNNASIV
jgi:hypothetical protein